MDQKTKKEMIGAVVFLVVFVMAMLLFNHWSYLEKLVAQLFK